MGTAALSRGTVASAGLGAWAVRLLPSLTDVAFAAPIAFLFLKLDGVKTLLGDGDTGWHIRAGEWMLANGTVPRVDMFSYTRPGEPWYAWEWLWELGAGWLHQQWGMAAVVLASLLLICLTAALLYRFTLEKCGNPLVAIGVTLLATAASSIHWLARPHLVSMLLTVVLYWMLERVRGGNRRLLWLMPPLVVLWTNMHGGFLAALVLLGAYAAGELAAEVLRDGGSVREGWRRMRPYAATGAACVAATLINPYSYRLHVHVWNYFTDSYHFENISEFLSISFHHPASKYFELALLMGIAAGLAAVRRRDYTSALLILAWGHMALVSARYIPLFAIVAAPQAAMLAERKLRSAAAADIAGWVRRAIGGILNTASEIGAVEKLPRVYAASAAAACVIGLALLAPAPFRKCTPEYDAKRYPAKAVDFLLSSGLTGRIYSDDEWGDYLIYRRFPVFVDGRSDFYGSEFGRKSVEVMSGKDTWRAMFARYEVDAALLSVTSPLAATLKEAREWRVLYDDGTAIVFRRSERYEVAAVAGSQHCDRGIANGQPSDQKVAQLYARR